MEQLIKNINNLFIQKESLLNFSKQQYKQTIINLKQKQQEEQNIKEAYKLIKDVAEVTQKQIQSYISNIVTMGIQTIFETDDKFIIEFEQKRNQVEVYFYLEDRNFNKINPFDADAGGLSDLVSFLLRISFWSVEKKGQTIILDEPFKQLSLDYHDRASYMLKKLSETFNLQFLIVTHSEEIKLDADKYFNIKKGQIK